MTSTTNFIPDEEVHRSALADPEYRKEWERTALANAVAILIIGYRIEHELTQAQLADRLGWKQPQVARLEIGEHNPRSETLMHICERLGIRMAIEIGPDRVTAEEVAGDRQGRPDLRSSRRAVSSAG